MIGSGEGEEPSAGRRTDVLREGEKCIFSPLLEKNVYLCHLNLIAHISIK